MLEINPYEARPVIATATAVTSSPVEDIAAEYTDCLRATLK